MATSRIAESLFKQGSEYFACADSWFAKFMTDEELVSLIRKKSNFAHISHAARRISRLRKQTYRSPKVNISAEGYIAQTFCVLFGQEKAQMRTPHPPLRGTFPSRGRQEFPACSNIWTCSVFDRTQTFGFIEISRLLLEEKLSAKLTDEVSTD